MGSVRVGWGWDGSHGITVMYAIGIIIRKVDGTNYWPKSTNCKD